MRFFVNSTGVCQVCHTNFQTRLRTRSGEELDVAISGTLIFDSAGRELGSIGFAKFATITVCRSMCEVQETLPGVRKAGR